MTNSDLEARARLYADSLGISIEKCLGYGSDGAVWKTNRRTAVKVFHSGKIYAVELECYHRLQEAGITEICGFAVPRLSSFDDKLLIIEMSLVNPPYVLDFGKVWLDRQPYYPPATIAYAVASNRSGGASTFQPCKKSSESSSRSAFSTPTPSRGISCRRTGTRSCSRHAAASLMLGPPVPQSAFPG